jgi:RNA polymerase sigma-70 factor (ECF subfamily)
VADDDETEVVADAGDWSFDAFFAASFPRLLGAMQLYCGDRDQGEEVAQEAMARACRDWSTVRTASSPEAWVHRVALNVANSWFRRLRTHRQREHLLATAAHGAADVSEGRDLVAALRQLTPRERQAVVLRYFADLSVAMERGARMRAGCGFGPSRWNGLPAGEVAAYRRAESGDASVAGISYVVGAPFRGVGVGCRAVGLMIEELHREWRPDLLVADISPDNFASQRVARVHGFEPELAAEPVRREGKDYSTIPWILACRA